MDILRLLTVMIFVLGVSGAEAQMYKWVDEDGNVSFSDRPPPTIKKESKGKVPPSSVSEQAAEGVAVRAPDNDEVVSPVLSAVGGIKKKVRGLLQTGQYEELNSLLSGYQSAASEKIEKEDELFTAYAAFDVEDDSYGPLLDAWLAATPDNYQPHLARAQFHYRMAWKARGTKWASETGEKQLEEMRAYFELATSDLEAVFEVTRENMVAYHILIGMMSSSARHEEMYQVLQHATQINPATYHVRLRFLLAITPRWGGSYELMEGFISQAQEYAELNPKLKLLPAQLFIDAGNVKALSRAYNAADELFTQAVNLAGDHYAYAERGENNYRRENYLDAIRDLDQAIALYPEQGDYFYYRSRSMMKLGRMAEALEDLLRAAELSPGESKVASQRRSLVSKLERMSYQQAKQRNAAEALRLANMALRLDRDKGSLYYRRARAQVIDNAYDAALSDMRRAVGLEPDEYDYYLLLDWLLAKKSSWQEIIGYWDNYIALNPDDGRAYVERGGAYFRSGDIRAAVENAKLAADLGNAEGVEAYNRFKGMVHD